MKIFKELANKQLIGIAILAFANLCSTVVVSCIGPFYPAEAERRGISQSQIGLLFGLFQLVMFISSPLLGKYLHLVGSKRMCIAGLLIAGMATIAFGFLNWTEGAVVFFWASLLFRFISAFGDACFLTASLALSAKCFPGRISTIVGILETFAGLGFTVGPLIGSVLHEKLGGFHMPFFVLSSLLLSAALFSCFLIEEVKDEPFDETIGMLLMLKIPSMWMMLFAVVLCAISLSFLDPLLSHHFRKNFKFNEIQIGLMALLCDGSYCLTATLWGMLLDRWNCNNFLMLFGSSATIVSLIIIGTLGDQLIWVCVSLVLLGIASGALYIPSFQQCLDVVKKKCYDDSFRTYGCISGLVQSSYALGGFIGPICFGGWGYETLGMFKTTLIIAAFNFFFIFALLGLLIVKRFFTPATYFIDDPPQSLIVVEESGSAGSFGIVW